MKKYLLEPSYKKSVLEYQVWEREVDGVKQRATLEIGWRSGSFELSVPETEDEVTEWANNRVGDPSYYKTAADVYNDYGVETYEEMKSNFLPDEEEDFIEVGDYDYEMLETWDGCWEDWSLASDDEELLEEIQEGWEEDSWDYMEQNGWMETMCYYEMTCPPVLKEVEEEKFEVDIS